MAILTVRRRGSSKDVVIRTGPAESLLSALLKAGFPIRHDCGGHALCGTCRVRVLEGERALSPVSERERERLVALSAAPGERLACQAHAVREVIIEPVFTLDSAEDET